MRALLDTHVAVWWLGEPARVRADARAILEDPDNELHLSAVSVWEATVKSVAGRLHLDVPLAEVASEAGLIELRVGWAHAQRAAELPRLHGDPFDRLLVAQAAEENLVLLTRDPLLTQYPIATMPA